MRQSSVFQNFLMQVHNGIGVIHLPCDGRWEHIWVVGMLLVFGNQQVNSLLWNTDLSDRCLRFGARECQLPIGVLDVLLADGDGFVRDVEVTPQEGSQLTLAQSADQFQIKHGQQSPLIRGVEVGLDMLRLEDLHLEFLHLRCDAVLGGVAEDQAFFYGAVQGIVKHQVQAADGGAAESRIAVTAFTSGAAALHQLLVELLQVVGSQLRELDAADAGDGIQVFCKTDTTMVAPSVVKSGENTYSVTLQRGNTYSFGVSGGLVSNKFTRSSYYINDGSGEKLYTKFTYTPGTETSKDLTIRISNAQEEYHIADKTYKLHITVQDAAAKPEFDKYVVTVNGKEAALKKVGTAYTLASLTQFDTLEIEAFVKNIDDTAVFKWTRGAGLAKIQIEGTTAKVTVDTSSTAMASI